MIFFVICTKRSDTEAVLFWLHHSLSSAAKEERNWSWLTETNSWKPGIEGLFDILDNLRIVPMVHESMGPLLLLLLLISAFYLVSELPPPLYLTKRILAIGDFAKNAELSLQGSHYPTACHKKTFSRNWIINFLWRFLLLWLTLFQSRTCC